MRIDCKDRWRQAVKYFLDEDTIATMKRLGLSVRKMDHAEQAIYLDADDAADLLKICASISAVNTKSNLPSPRRGAVKTTVLAESF